jgi:hypothetical protein
VVTIGEGTDDDPGCEYRLADSRGNTLTAKTAVTKVNGALQNMSGFLSLISGRLKAEQPQLFIYSTAVPGHFQTPQDN